MSRPIPRKYSFCETAAATEHTAWHIRELTEKGKKFGGGADTPALCGRKVAWDLDVTITKRQLDNGCRKCAEEYQKLLLDPDKKKS